MSKRSINTSPARTVGVDVSVALGITALLFFFIASGFLSYWNTRGLNVGAQEVTSTHQVVIDLENFWALMKDTETGQRGFVLTGNERYLEPYSAAVGQIDQKLDNLQRSLEGYPDLQSRIPIIRSHVHAKLDELAETIALRRTKGFDAALAVVLTDRGKGEMDIIRGQISAVEQLSADIRRQRLADMDGAYKMAITSGVVSALIGVFLSFVIAYLVRRTTIARQRQQWLQTGQVKLADAMLGELRQEQLGENILKFVAEYVDAHAAAFFIKSGDTFQRSATYGLASDSKTPTAFTMGDGLLGQSAKDRRMLFVNDVPDDYMTVSSSLGSGKPRYLVIAPTYADGVVNGVMEFGFINPVSDAMKELLESLANPIGIAIRSANYRANLQNFLEETQRQAEELQAQSEELRVANEELEEQSRSLRESQARLEQQQVEQEQTNAQLEEQTQLLETQRDDLVRTQAAVQAKATELERASRYKSDFLANMSHELRTPLNSSLIMSKLLADNPEGNLTPEQVKFALTIQSSGNDLLSLINDILDLSKIEAGHLDIRPESVQPERLMNDLRHTFDPLVAQKGLAFHIEIAKDCPAYIETDRQRLLQILKNLISNAIKFTESGSVTVKVIHKDKERIAFEVTDTGIGIAEEQQQAIFEAFRQADGTISRKYGGTGLGLSISRELTRLLGGKISLHSQHGQGSTFTVTLPEVYNPEAVAEAKYAIPALADDGKKTQLPMEANLPPPAPKPKTENKRARKVNDDREKLVSGKRCILIVEDDETFSKLLYDMMHEFDFSCLVANTAEDALALAQQYLPSAVILDVGLPDHSGLSVLDWLKRDGRTRHIPVHVVSAGDYAQTAMSLGAVGYMLKPVSRDKLTDALKNLEARLEQRLRRVLIVEDDPVQSDSVRRLLTSQDVEALTVGTAAECLEKLKGETFDCMVLDLSLPDASGYSLLETLSQEDAYSFPPVIVYTGRDLSADEEQRLRRYSKSIIIKGAKSPERLLDEVTLFLHQVVADLPPEQQKMIERAGNRDSIFERRRILVVEDDIRNVYALTSIFEPRGAVIQIARNGREALEALEASKKDAASAIDLILMDVMMPEMDGMTATREIRKKSEWKKLPIIMLTAKAMKDDQERCLDAGANDYMPKPIDVEKLLSLVRVWLPR